MNKVKKKLIGQIENLESEEVMKVISDMLNKIGKERIYHLTERKISALNESMDQIALGEIVEHKDLMN